MASAVPPVVGPVPTETGMPSIWEVPTPHTGCCHHSAGAALACVSHCRHHSCNGHSNGPTDCRSGFHLAGGDISIQVCTGFTQWVFDRPFWLRRRWRPERRRVRRRGQLSRFRPQRRHVYRQFH